MAIKIYTCNYDFYEAEAIFTVDTEIFKPEDAQLLLDFFSWDYDTEADPIDEIVKKYALQAILVGTAHDYNKVGVISWFEKSEGYLQIDGTNGVKLIGLSNYEFDEDKLEVRTSINVKKSK